MGVSGISPGSLLLIFLIIVVLFGTKKLASLGEDLGKAVHGFKKGLRDAQESAQASVQDKSKNNIDQ